MLAQTYESYVGPNLQKTTQEVIVNYDGGSHSVTGILAYASVSFPTTMGNTLNS